MDEIRLFQIWISDLLFYHVFFHALEYLSGICRKQNVTYDGHTALDHEASLALGLPRHFIFRRHRTVRIRILQRYAHFYHIGIRNHALM